MSQPGTEQASERYRGLDTWSGGAILDAIAQAQRAAIDAVAAAVPSLALAGEAAAAKLRAGGRLIYVGAGSSGLLAQVDALELPGTYGIAASQVPVLLAGGPAALLEIPSEAEDDAPAAVAAVDELRACAADVLVAISASGRTPYAVAALTHARARGALTIGVANNPATPLLAAADHPVLLATPPEVIAGSTRMNAGTAQKCALNMLSTLIGIRLGHGYDGLMVNVRAENEKLRGRAAGIVARAAGVNEATAMRAMEACGDDVKPAIVLSAGAANVADARARLTRSGGDLRACLDELAAARGEAR
jgi:N-acetylmuramic acid 6-phosphate etherase